MELINWLTACCEQGRAQAVEVSVDHIKAGFEQAAGFTIVRRILVRCGRANLKQFWVLRNHVFVPKVSVIDKRANPLFFKGQGAEFVAVGLARKRITQR